MRIKKLIALSLIAVLGCGCLTGCGSYSDEIAQLNNISALGSESTVKNDYKLSYTDQQELIYAQVSNRTLLDLSTLSACSASELQQVVTYMDSVDDQLVGNAKSGGVTSILEDLEGKTDNGIIDVKFTDYLLAEFEKTPYYWQRNKLTVRGIDPESRSIIVDVTYKTIDHKKTVKGDSKIVQGSPAYAELVKNRYDRYLNILSMKLNDSSNPLISESIDKFTEVYGDPKEIYESQSNLGLTDYVYYYGNQRTYTSCIDSDAEKSGGTMTVRYVLVPKYVLGINLGITCKHMYILNYQLDNDITENLETFKAEGYATVSDNVYELLYSYFKCIDESNFNGLYKLSTNFAGLDKYYEDMFNTSYRKHNNFTITLFDIKGTHITCGVSISSKVRAKGSNITMPIYTDRYYVEIELVDDALKIDNLTLLSRTLEGEPAITTDKANTSGFSAEIDLSNDDRLAIEKLICNFSLLQLLKDTTSEDFENTVDLSISNNDMTELKTNMTELSGDYKVSFLQTYMQGTSNYASVKCKELFQAADRSIVEANVVYEFIKKGGEWNIIGYNITSTIKLNTTNLQTTGSLCLVSKEKVESYTSQLKNTSSSSTNIDNISDVSVSYNYDAYTPSTKHGTSEQGKLPLGVDDLSVDMYKSVDSGYEDTVKAIKEIAKSNSTLADDILAVYQNELALLYNYKSDRYSQKSLNDQKSNIEVLVTSLKTYIDENVKDTKLKSDCDDLMSSINSCLSQIKELK